MSSIHNESEIRNQVGGQQNVYGSINNGPVYHVYHVYHGRVEDKLSLDSEKLESVTNDILKSLSFHQMLSRRGDIEQPHINTCQWIFDVAEYQNWKQNSRGLLWIKGKPGAGKSTLMSFLYSHIQEERRDIDLRQIENRDIRLDFFFTARGTELQRTPLGMLRSLLNQLVRQDAQVRQAVAELYTEKCRAFGQPSGSLRSWEWQRRELESLLRTGILKSARKRRVNIFIDALDEAGEQSAREVAQYFHLINDSAAEAVTLPGTFLLKVCISCRHYPVASTTRGLEIWVEKYNGRDITKFIHDRLGPALRLSEDLRDLHEWLRLEQEMAEKAQGVFQWVRLVIPILEQCIDEGEPISTVWDWLRKVPKELADVYTFILCSVIKPANSPQSFGLFQWVCFAERPLTLEEMRLALSMNSNVGRMQREPGNQSGRAPTHVEGDARMEKRMKALSGGLIEVSDIQPSEIQWPRYVQVVHQSVNDFFLSRGLAILESLSNVDTSSNSIAEIKVDRERILQKSHATLYWCCLTYLVRMRDGLDEPEQSDNMSSQSGVPDPWSYEVPEPWVPEVPPFNLRVKDISTSIDTHRPSEIFVRGVHQPETSLLQYAFTKLFLHAEKASRFRTCGDYNFLLTELQHLSEIHPGWLRTYRRLEAISAETLNDGSSLLHVLSLFGLHDLVKHHLEPANVYKTEVCDDFKNTSLHLAAKSDHLAVAEILIDKGARIHAKNKSLQTPLMLAASNGHLTLVTWLLSKGANLNEVLDASQKFCKKHHTKATMEL